jgi:predicted lipoprotein with Yx(FWY)xxD motif
MRNNRRTAAAIVAGLVVIAIAATGAMALGGSSGKSKAVVKTGTVLGKKSLVTRSGMTLYSLSAETHGRFICSNATCLALWKPLTVTHGTKPTGASHLGTVRRPDGRTQVTFQGKPLYSFVSDTKPGQAKGNGFKDVGTWHVATVSGGTTNQAPMQNTTPSYGGY